MGPRVSVSVGCVELEAGRCRGCCGAPGWAGWLLPTRTGRQCCEPVGRPRKMLSSGCGHLQDSLASDGNKSQAQRSPGHRCTGLGNESVRPQKPALADLSRKGIY